MDCMVVRQEFFSYMDGNLCSEKEQKITDHLRDCDECSQVFADFLSIGNAIAQTSPSVWYKRKKYIFPYIKNAAALLLSFIIGWGTYHIRNKTEKNNEKEQQEVLHLITRNLNQRKSISENNRLLIRKLEKKLAQKTGLELQIQKLHDIEILCENKEYPRAITKQKAFLQIYKATPLKTYISLSLAQNLKAQKNYKEAIVLIKSILRHPFAREEKRGELLWDLADCYLKANMRKKYYKVVDRLSQNIRYSDYYWKAIVSKADYEFQQYNFLKANTLYAQYKKYHKTVPFEINRRMTWMESHKHENFYPLILYLQAKKKGVSSYFGLKLILTQYPDSPLAIHAFKMCLTKKYIDILGSDIPVFPKKYNQNTLFHYISHVSRESKLYEIADFALYHKARLLEKRKQYKEACKVYKKIILKQTGNILEEKSQKAIWRLKKLRSSI